MSTDTDEWARRLNAHAVAAKFTFTEMLEGSSGFAPIITAFRKSDVVCMAIPGEGDGEVIAGTAQAMASGFHADSIMITSDTYGATSWINPMTGKRWNHGEMELVAEKYDGLAKGWVHEALVLTVITRDGRQLMHQLPYVRASDGKGVTWLDEQTPKEWQELLIGRFTMVMQAPALTNLDALERELGRKPSRAEMDVVVAGALADPEIGRCTQVMLLQSSVSEN